MEVEVRPEEQSRVAWQAKWRRAKEEAGRGAVQQQEQELEQEEEEEEEDEGEKAVEKKAAGEHPDEAAERVESRLRELVSEP